MEREYFYKNENRQLLWIFNLQNTYYNIEKINFYCKSIYRIKIKGGYISFMYLLNKQLIKKPNIILDPGYKYLYIIRNDYKNSDNFIEISLIKRSYFLEQLINYEKINVEEFEMDYEIECINKIDYVQEINKLNNIKVKYNTKNIEDIHKCFYIIENLHFKYFYDDIYDYFIIEGFIIVGEILSKISNKNPIIMNLWIKWIEKNIPQFQDKMIFGKYEGEKLWLINNDYIIWLYNNTEIYDEELEYKISLLEKMYNKDILKKIFSKSHI